MRAAARPRRRAREPFNPPSHAPTPSTSHVIQPDVVDEDDACSRPKPDDVALDQAALASALSCPITGRIFVEPCTTPCGHTFEREALARWMTRRDLERANPRDAASSAAGVGASCPRCRGALYHEMPHEWPINTVVRECVEAIYGVQSFPAESGARDGVSDGNHGVSSGPRTTTLPVFFLDALVPGQECSLNVYEARYKVLVRRALSGTRKFLMLSLEDLDEDEFLEATRRAEGADATVGAGGAEDEDGRWLPSGVEVPDAMREGCRMMRVSLKNLGRYCVECHIVSAQELMDGRFVVRVKALKHAYVRSAERDPAGYVVAQCSHVSDDDINVDPATRCRVLMRAERAKELFDIWVATTSGPRWLYNYGGKMSTLLQHVGPRPAKDDLHALSWWMIRVLNPLPTIDGTIEMRSISLNAKDVESRFRVIAQMLIYSMALVQHVRAKDWVRREHAIAACVLDKLLDNLEEAFRDGDGGHRRTRAPLVEGVPPTWSRLWPNERAEPIFRELASIIRRAGWSVDQDPDSRTGDDANNSEDFVSERFVSGFDGERGVVYTRTWADAPDFMFDAAAGRLADTHGISGVVLAAWRVLANLESDDEDLKHINERLLALCGANLSLCGVNLNDTVTSVNDVLGLSGAFVDLLRRDMRAGVYKFLYIFDLARFAAWFIYRTLVLIIFALGFIFEAAFDREFHGGYRTAIRGVALGLACVFGAKCGFGARAAYDAIYARSTRI